MKYILLLYVSRSGSTLFSSELAKASKQILVLPELNMFKTLLKMAVGELAKNQVVDELLRDRRWESMDISRLELENIFKLYETNQIKEILDAICSLRVLKLQRPQPEYVILKKGDNIRYVGMISEYLQQTPLIVHVYRDPRAVYNSMNKATRIKYKNEKLSRGDPIHVARSWASYMENVDSFVDPVGVIHVRYEDLVSNVEATIESVLVKLNLTRQQVVDSEKERYLIQVHGPEKDTLHRRVAEQSDASRISAFSDEMDEFSVRCIEYWTGSEMERKGYSVSGRGKYTLYFVTTSWLFHLWRTFVFYSKRCLSIVRFFLQNKK